MSGLQNSLYGYIYTNQTAYGSFGLSTAVGSWHLWYFKQWISKAFRSLAFVLLTLSSDIYQMIMHSKHILRRLWLISRLPIPVDFLKANYCNISCRQRNDATAIFKVKSFRMFLLTMYSLRSMRITIYLKPRPWGMDS